MKLGVVIVTYNRIELLKECIANCINQVLKFDKIFVINNASTDGTTEFLNNLAYDNIMVINSKENLGGSGGFYEGIKIALNYDLDYLLLIDDDAILDANYNDEIAKHIKNDKDIYAFSGTVMTDGKIQGEHRKHLKRGFKCLDSKEEEYKKEYFDYELSTFCGLYVSMEIIKKIGLPEKDFFIWFDDTEYSLRILKYSKIRNINTAILNHKTKLVANAGFSWKSYYGLRNQIVIIKKYYSKLVLIKNIFKMKKMILGGKILAEIKKNDYYCKVSKMYEDSLKDGLEEKLGKNSQYLSNFKLEK